MYLNKKIHDILLKLACDTFPGRQFEQFSVEIIAKAMASRHGDYHKAPGKSAKIRVVNLERGTSHIVCTSIHEVAHHCEMCLHGKTGHSKRFYEIYSLLLERALQDRLITLDMIEDKWDIQKLQKKVGHLSVAPGQAEAADNGSRTIKIRNGFEIKDVLKQKGYAWNGIELTWCKDVATVDLDAEVAWLRSLTVEENIVVSAEAVSIDCQHLVLAEGNTFPVKDQLRGAGYSFRGFKIEVPAWVKRVPQSQLETECAFLGSLPEVEYRTVIFRWGK